MSRRLEQAGDIGKQVTSRPMTTHLTHPNPEAQAAIAD